MKDLVLMSEILQKITDPKEIKDLDEKELEMLAKDLREFLIESVSNTGGHFASNLGVIDLTVALFKNFDFSENRIIWDVGHQSYAYKILTGRKDKFNTLRQYGGLCGFPKRTESEYDFFATGHSSTSLSSAAGMARAQKILGKDNKVIAVIGDGALTGGMALEALNDIGYRKDNLIIMSKKVLFVTQEMTPYVPESPMAIDGRKLPQALQEKGCEIRTFMPRWGIINERRNQLHEVIRLSGMNIIIDDTDHPLIIKVASIQAARMQVYFIDNDDYFHKRGMFAEEDGKEYEDNIERAVFYARGVLETVKKLRWCPDVIYCQGWISAVVPFYIKTAYREEPSFANTKVISSLYGEMPNAQLTERFAECLEFRDANAEAVAKAGVDLTQADSLGRLAVAFSDGIIEGEAGKQDAMLEYAKSLNIPVLNAPTEEEKAAAYKAFVEQVAGE